MNTGSVYKTCLRISKQFRLLDKSFLYQGRLIYTRAQTTNGQKYLIKAICSTSDLSAS